MTCIAQSISGQIIEHNNDLSKYDLSYSIYSPEEMKTTFSGIKLQNDAYITSMFVHKNMDITSKIYFVAPKHDVQLAAWYQYQMQIRNMQNVKGRYVLYNKQLFYEAVAKSGEGETIRLHHVAVTKNNGRILVYEGCAPIKLFAKAAPLFARQISSFHFSGPYKPDVRIDKYKTVKYGSYKLSVPVDWHISRENKDVRFSLNGAEIIIRHAGDQKAAKQDAETFTARIKNMDADHGVGKARQLPGIDGWETILMRSPAMKRDSETWMRSEYLYATLISGIAAQTPKLVRKQQQKRQSAYLAALDKRITILRKLKAWSSKRKARKEGKSANYPAPRNPLVNASGGIGIWGSNKHPAMKKCKYANISCLP